MRRTRQRESCEHGSVGGGAGTGWVSAFWIRGYPDLPARSPLCGSIDGLVRPSFTSKHSRPS